MGVDGTGGRRESLQPPHANSGVNSESPREDVTHVNATAPEKAEVALADYARARADEAVMHLVAILTDEELRLIKEQLMDQMLNDPTVATLVERGAGARRFQGKEEG